jgi:hypothetical protein
MPRPQANPVVPVPRWLIIVGSVAIVFHLSAVIVGALAAPSGPWPSMEGRSMATPPQFAFSIQQQLTGYLKAVHMTHNYHFADNNPSMPGIYFEARLKDDKGAEIATLKFPDDNANRWLRHRQLLLARVLGDDQPAMPPQSESVPAPGQKVPTIEVWEMVEPQKLKLETKPQHLLPRNQMSIRPSEWSMLAVKSYARYLGRTHGAKTVEIIRHSKDPYPPMVLYTDNLPQGAFEELVSNFGELPR